MQSHKKGKYALFLLDRRYTVYFFMKKSKINQERDFLKKSHQKVQLLESILTVTSQTSKREADENYSYEQFYRDDQI